MKRLVLGCAALVVLAASGTAMAADLPVKATIYEAPQVYNWTGFYVGGHVGFGQSKNRFFDVNAGSEAASFSANGFLGGGQVGYNWQVGQWVVGVEGEGSLSRLRHGVITAVVGTSTVLANTGSECTTTFNPATGTFVTVCRGTSRLGARTHALGLFTSRLGYAWNNWLAYAKAGLAVADVEYVVNASSVLSAQATDTRWGWMVGAGIEHGLSHNWSAKLEYNFVDLGTRRITAVAASGLSFSQDQEQQIQTVKVGINYRFGGPVTARR